MTPRLPIPELSRIIQELAGQVPLKDRDAARSVVSQLLTELERGAVRAAELDGDVWRAVEWVKQGILLAFRSGETKMVPEEGGTEALFRFSDRDTLPVRGPEGVSEGVRIVPGGSAVRAGAYLGPRVVIMPPAYVNVGAWIGEDSMVDSHALVGSCAQIGARVHLSAGAQIGGVLEPIGLRPVIVEDEAMIGANVGLFEGVLVGRRSVIAPGVQLTAGTPLFDLVRDTVYRASPGHPLSVPEGAVVVPGTRPARGEFATEQGLQLYAAIVVKYRDQNTDAATTLEEVLR